MGATGELFHFSHFAFSAGVYGLPTASVLKVAEVNRFVKQKQIYTSGAWHIVDHEPFL